MRSVSVSILDPEGRLRPSSSASDADPRRASASVLDADWLTMAEAARLLGVHVSTIWRWRNGVRGRRLRCTKIGPGKTVVLRSDLEQFIAAISDPPDAATADSDLVRRAADADAKARALGL